ncbi:MAG: PQQ-dependent sugar dehydrogenase [Synechococcales cyanobacterium T60_A2020_003]|nr:PQQ-dependent sugar dehydrogenase [Synechococcales cyanobacterium T60_A2020_003]
MSHLSIPLVFGAFLLGACTVSCAPAVDSTGASTATPASDPRSTTLAADDGAIAPDSASIIPTQPLPPSPIRITVEDLPRPFATQSASKPPTVIPVPANPVLNVPDGFTVNVFADGLDRPRWLALTPSGDVLVVESRNNRILHLKDTTKDGAADERITFATAENGLNLPFGMAFAPGYFFVGNTDAVMRFPYDKGQDQLTGTGEAIAPLPGQGYNQHWTRNVIVSPERQKLFVSVGSETNVDEEPLPRASVLSMNWDGSDTQVFASGLRNPVGLAIHPQTGDLYTTVNERDGIGDDLVPDFFTRLQPGAFYGWPYTYLKPDLLDPRQMQGDQSRNPTLAAQTQTPDVLFQAHSAALGLQFYDGSTFPERYQNGAFVAMRGSWNRNEGTGYKLVFIPFNDANEPDGYYEDFLTGFLVDPRGPTTWGRPVGLLVMPDGSLLFTEEMNGRIYRVQYTGTDS